MEKMMAVWCKFPYDVRHDMQRFVDLDIIENFAFSEDEIRISNIFWNCFNTQCIHAIHHHRYCLWLYAVWPLQHGRDKVQFVSLGKQMWSHKILILNSYTILYTQNVCIVSITILQSVGFGYHLNFDQSVQTSDKKNKPELNAVSATYCSLYTFFGGNTHVYAYTKQRRISRRIHQGSGNRRAFQVIDVLIFKKDWVLSPCSNALGSYRTASE